MGPLRRRHRWPLAAAARRGRRDERAVAGPAQPIEDAGPVFNASSQYTAVYQQAQGQWRILPATGQDLAIATGDCAAGRAIPKGVWLVTRDDQGRVELLARRRWSELAELVRIRDWELA